MKIIPLLLTLLYVIATKGQSPLSARVKVNVVSMPLETLLHQLQSQHNIRFFYALDNVQAKIPITIKENDTALLNVIAQLATQANLDFAVFSNTIVFQPKATAMITKYKSPLTDSIATHGRQNAIVVQPVSLTNTVFQIIPCKRPLLPASFNPMKDNATTLYKSVPTATRWGIQLHFSRDYNHYSFQKSDISFQRFDRNINTAWGTDISYQLTTKLKISTGMKFVQRDFTFHHNYQVFDSRDPFPIPDETYVDYRYLEIPLIISFKIVDKRQFAAYLTTSVAQSILTSKKENTSYLNKEPQQSSRYIGDTSSRLYSGSLGLLFQYALLPSVRIAIGSSVIHYSKPLNSAAMNSAATTLRLQSGISYSFVRKIKSI